MIAPTKARHIGLAATSIFAITAAVGASASSATDSTPEPMPGSSSSLAATLLPVVTEQMEQMQIPGLIVYVSTPDGDTWQAALGVSDVTTQAPMDFDDHVRIGSITKTLTGTVILQLAQEGKLDLDDPLEQYLPGMDTNDATIRQALSLTSGIPDFTTAEFLNGLADEPQRTWSPEEIIGLVDDEAPLFPAGTSWQYSNTNFVMLGLIAESVTGRPLDELVQERIFDPLGMTGCSLPDAADATIPGPRTQGYMLGTQWDRDPSPPAGLPEKVDVTDWSPSWALGTGHGICTATDLAIWAEALATGELLDPAMQEQRLDWQDTGNPISRYGLAVANLDGLVGHNGEISGYMSQAARRESDGTVIVVLSNLLYSPDNQETATIISYYISQAIPPS